jgi:CDP-paratose 2-epimerase
LPNYLITGGAGFIGTNLADHLSTAGHRVTVLDNFARHGSADNAQWLRQRHGEAVTVVEGDIRYPSPLDRLVENADVVFHLAAQVAVTTSVTNPRADFEINALGTFNVMEAVRNSASKPIVVYSSTNKVYGKMSDLNVVEREGRYAYENCPDGASETRCLDFYSPYGCSKGIGDQYVIDYSRIYGLRTVVFRQSCIYGPHQFGIEDQGWLAWFAIQALRDQPVTVYGDGKQVRDVLYIDDLVAAFESAVANIDKANGQAFNKPSTSAAVLRTRCRCWNSSLFSTNTLDISCAIHLMIGGPATNSSLLAMFERRRKCWAGLRGSIPWKDWKSWLLGSARTNA